MVVEVTQHFLQWPRALSHPVITCSTVITLPNLWTASCFDLVRSRQRGSELLADPIRMKSKEQESSLKKSQFKASKSV